MKKAIALSLLLISGSLLAHDEATSMTSTAKSAAAKPVKAKKKKAPKVSTAPKKEEKPMEANKGHWVCPMHDGGESDHAGKCPKCGMDLVLEKADASQPDSKKMDKM